jgi:regulatory protein
MPSDRWRGDVTAGVTAWAGGRSAATRASGPPKDPIAQGPPENAEAVARKILLDQLTGQARSRQQLRDKLAQRNVPDELAERLLDRFTEVGLINDEAFARLWVESRQRSRGLSTRALSQELRRKGVADDIVREVLDEVEPDDEESRARELVRKKARSMSGLDRVTATRRLAGLLARKGYPAGLAFRIVREELADRPDDALAEPPDPT